MIAADRELWTIIVVGNWNVGIFSPQWLRDKIFHSKEIRLDVGIEPGLPRRITGDNVTLIPTPSKLTLLPADLNKTTLLRMQEISCKILEILEHTPITATGINYGYRLTDIPEELRNKFPSLYNDEFSNQQLIVKSREYTWNLKDQEQIINLFSIIENGSILIKFNFHTPVNNAIEARNSIRDKIIDYKTKSKSILEHTFNIIFEDDE